MPRRPDPVVAGWLAGLALLAAVLRLVWIAEDPLWFDEAATLGIASLPWGMILGPVAAEESSPPGYYALAKLWGAAFGGDIVTVRLMSVLAGVAAVILLGVVGRAWFGARAGLVAAALLALDALHVRASQDARVYAVLFLVAALGLVAALRLVRGGGVAAALGLGLAMGAALWLHPTAGIAALALNAGVVAGLAQAGGLRRGLILLAMADLLALAMASAPILAAMQHVTDPEGYADRWIEPPGPGEAAALYWRSLVGPFLGPRSGLLALGLEAVLLGAALWGWWRERSATLAALAAMLAAGLVLLPVASQFRPVLLDRTALFLAAPLALLLAAGAARLRPGVAVAVVVPTLALAGLGVANWHLQENRKERWDLAAAMLARQMRPGEPVVLTEGAFPEISLAWHFGQLGVAVPRILLVVPTSDMEELAAQELTGGGLVRGRTVEPGRLCAALGGAAGAWLVSREVAQPVSDDADFTRRGEARAALRAAGGSVAATLRMRGVALERWVVPGC